jgi:ATP-dependent DNA ligase
MMGREGLVSNHRESVYRDGGSPRWVKVKNRKHPAFSRMIDQFG